MSLSWVNIDENEQTDAYGVRGEDNVFQFCIPKNTEDEDGRQIVQT